MEKFVNLKNIAEVKIGLFLGRKKQNQNDKKGFEYDVVSLQSFFDEKGIFDGSITNKIILCEELDKKQCEKFLVKKGDILIRTRNPVTAVLVDKNYKKLIFSDLFIRVRNLNRYNPKLLVEYFNTYSEQEYGSCKRTTVNSIAKFKIPNLSLDEQKEIIKSMKKYDSKNKKLQEQILKNNELKKNILRELKDKK